MIEVTEKDKKLHNDLIKKGDIVVGVIRHKDYKDSYIVGFYRHVQHLGIWSDGMHYLDSFAGSASVRNLYANYCITIKQYEEIRNQE